MTRQAITRYCRCVLLAVSLAWSASSLAAAEPGRSPDEAIERALAFLSREVPQWSRENHCYSCHNNGDAARALYEAARRGYRVGPQVLADTTAWLRRPEQWEHNGGEGEFSDKKLAAIQFGAALVEAIRTDARADKSPLRRAARMVADEQEEDGSWRIDAAGVLGSPATYGSYLATAMALRTLQAADDPQLQAHTDRAEVWLRKQRPKATLDAAATLLALAGADGAAAVEQRRRCLETLRRAQGESGGWGPYAASPPEPFDTAIAILALSRLDDAPRRRQMIERGRRYLAATQRDDGSWPETTRPPNAVSYAQRLSTAGWATLALLSTEQELEP